MTIEDLEAGSFTEQSPREVSPTLAEMRQRLAELAHELEEEATENVDDASSSALGEIASGEVLELDARSVPAISTSQDAEAPSLATLSHEELLQAALLLQSERDAFREKVSQLPDLSRLEETKRQFEQAVAEIQYLRQRNSELEAVDGVDAENRNSELDWESQKEQWLSKLQGDSVAALDQEEAPVKQEDSLVDHLNQRIHDLQEQVGLLTDKLARTSEIDAMLDADEIVRAERARLAELQEQWQDKARSCELELSKERAHLTRLRLELEERARTLDSLKERLERQQAGAPVGRNWLGFLDGGKG